MGKASLAQAGACGGCLVEVTESVAGCAADDAQKRELYDAWRTSPNDLSAFAGTVWKGRAAAEVSATLTIHNDLTAELYVGEGEPPVPIANQGFLCTDLDCVDQPFFHGGVYPIHGATYVIGENENDRNLHFDLNPLSPFDGWCRLQVPRLAPEAVAGGSCEYTVVSSGGDLAPPPCQADGEVVDCKWLEIARDLNACDCTSSGCFARTIWAPGDPWILKGSFTADLQYDPEKQSLSGSIKTFQQRFQGEDSRDLNLWLVSPRP